MLDLSRTVPRAALCGAGFAGFAGLALAALLAGCGTPPDGVEQTGSDQSAVGASQAQGTCTLIAGADPFSLGGHPALLLPGAPYTGPDANVLQAQEQLTALGTGGYFAFRTVYASDDYGATFSTWDAVDVTGDPASAVTAIVNEYASTSPVMAGYFECTYSFGPGAHPYAPTYVVAYDRGLTLGPRKPPRGCTSCPGPI